MSPGTRQNRFVARGGGHRKRRHTARRRCSFRQPSLGTGRRSRAATHAGTRRTMRGVAAFETVAGRPSSSTPPPRRGRAAATVFPSLSEKIWKERNPYYDFVGSAKLRYTKFGDKLEMRGITRRLFLPAVDVGIRMPVFVAAVLLLHGPPPFFSQLSSPLTEIGLATNFPLSSSPGRGRIQTLFPWCKLLHPLRSRQRPRPNKTEF